MGNLRRIKHRFKTKRQRTVNSVIFRFFPEEWQAEALCHGKVWISTLEKCRGYEDPQQGDPGEGTLIYNSGTISGDSDDPKVGMIAERSGIYIAPGVKIKELHISNNTVIRRINDAYVLCTTEAFSPEKLSDTFGKYCVSITDPINFFKILSKALGAKFKVEEAAIGRVAYNGRNYHSDQPLPGSIGFLKPPDKYTDQREVRMLWRVNPSHLPLKPFSLECPEVAKICKRVA